MKNHLTWLRPDQGLPELNWERVLIITVDGAVATLPEIKCCDWAARGDILLWAEIPLPKEYQDQSAIRRSVSLRRRS